MSQIDRLIESLIPLEAAYSPWDPQRWLLRMPTAEEVKEAPRESLFYYNNWNKIFNEYPDQGNRGTCVGWGSTEDAEINRWWQDGIMDDLSPEDCYHKARKYDGLPDFLEGSNILGAMKARQKEGICLEETYPTSIDKSKPSPGIQKPLDEYRKEAGFYVIDNYYQIALIPTVWVTSIAGIISDPQWEGPKPIKSAYKVTRTMLEYAEEHNGIMPDEPGSDFAGAHCSLITDYKYIDDKLYLGNLNSWGPEWGDNGYGWFPTNYLFNGIFMEGWISHYGPPITPSEPEAGFGCVIARALVDFLCPKK